MSDDRTSAGAEIIWDAAHQAPTLLEVYPRMREQLQELRANFPVAPDLAPFDNGSDIRPFRHLRAFYRRTPEGVVAVKGTEPLAGDPRAHLGILANFRIDYPGRGRSLFSALEHFPLVEQKIPLAMTAAEAMEDVTSAAAIQTAHLGKYAQLARTPLPLLAVRWPAAVSQNLFEVLGPMLSNRARGIVKQQMAGGLGSVIYHYPTLPLRVAHLPAILGVPGGNHQWPEKLAALTDPAATIDNWISLVARILGSGYIPGSIESIGIGHCLEMKNAVIDGGFVDMGSVIRCDAIRDDQAFAEALLAAIADLTKTIRHFLLGDAVDVEAEYRNPSLVMIEALRNILPQLAAQVQDARPDDPRIAEFFSPRSAAAGLMQGLRALHPAAAPTGGHA